MGDHDEPGLSLDVPWTLLSKHTGPEGSPNTGADNSFLPGTLDVFQPV